MKYRILVIEDEPAINDLICMNLESAGYETVGCMDGDIASRLLIDDSGFHCAIVDVMLPGKDGFELLPELNKYHIPVIFLTARVDVKSKVYGLKNGAEDYMVKPFEPLELLIRIEKIIERKFPNKEIVRILDVEIDTSKRKVTKNGVEIVLKPMEYDCMMMFVKYKNKALSREQILSWLWGQEFEGETRTVDAHVGRIRKKLDWQEVIKTIPKVGYRLEVEE